MQITETKLSFLEEDNYFSFNKEFDNWLSFTAEICFESEKFTDFQKDLLEDFIGDILDKMKEEHFDLNEVKSEFEMWLQNLNTKLKIFAEKVRDVEYFPIKWYMQIIADNTLITSMIWNVTLLIFRNNSLYYSLHNSISSKSKIDLFSDFIEWDIENRDEIIYAGTKVSDALDDVDIKQMENVLESEDDLPWFIEEILSSRVDSNTIWFINHYKLWYNIKSINQKKTIPGLSNKWWKINPKFGKWKKELLANKYYATIIVLSIVILFMLYHVLSQVLEKNEWDTFITSSWIEVAVTIEDIKKDIYYFQSLDSTNDEKWLKYYEVMEKLDFLEEKWRWIEDVSQLRKILQADYHKWFNIIYLNNLAQFDDPATNTKTRVLSFNNAEKEKLWELSVLERWRNLMIAWSNASMIDTVNDGMRWILIEYGLEEAIKWCSPNLLRDGIYCFTPEWRIFNITKAGIETVITSSPGWFPSDIAGAQVYGKSNMYIFQSSLDNKWSKQTLLTRYRNDVWSQTQFQEWQDYNVSLFDSGFNIGSWIFTAFAIDYSFLVWSDGRLLQFRREVPSSPTLDVREVPLMWWDKITSTYSDDVKIISTINSKFVYIFDKTNQSFTVYESRPVKTNDANISTYSLYYLFRFTFDLEDNKVVDVTIPESTSNRPELYILSKEGVNKVNLYDFIDSVKEDDAIRELNG